MFAFSSIACMLVHFLSLHVCLFAFLCVYLLALLFLLLTLLLCFACSDYYFFLRLFHLLGMLLFLFPEISVANYYILDFE